MHGAVVCLGVVRLKLDVQGQWGGRSLDLDGQGGGESRMCIIPYKKFKCPFLFWKVFWEEKNGKCDLSLFIITHEFKVHKITFY